MTTSSQRNVVRNSGISRDFRDDKLANAITPRKGVVTALIYLAVIFAMFSLSIAGYQFAALMGIKPFGAVLFDLIILAAILFIIQPWKRTNN